ncbi:MAG: membrane protein insertion efficiency factor YidD [Spirochaetaceae bacterium]|nr:MAG: membrane protein insertion efficiency factor YidD [Spirochaetaceae bacterium]
MHLLRYIAIAPLFLYQKVVSPLLPGSCNYFPTCSEYTRRAILTHGVMRGILMGAMRIGRCSSRFYGGTDPVPEAFDFARLRREYTERSVRRHRRDLRRGEGPGPGPGD